MFGINVLKKTGYRITDPYTPINIRDERGLLFYSTEGMTPRVKQFNLPPLGNFTVESGKFKEMETPVNYRLTPLPSPQRVYPSPIGYPIDFVDNKHKGTVNFLERGIKLDVQFLEKPLPQIYFIVYHEYAHQFFKSEKWADVLASNYMLVKGFNPSQIANAHVVSLSCRQHERKKFNIEKLVKYNGHEGNFES